jgi:hypothetical protein
LLSNFLNKIPPIISSQETNKAPLGTYISGEPMERVAVDIFGPLPLTKQGNKYILVISDLFTKWTEAIAIPNQESTTICKAPEFCQIIGVLLVECHGNNAVCPVSCFVGQSFVLLYSIHHCFQIS